jgi:hypothetical protein
VDAGQHPARERERDRKGSTFAEVADRYMRELCEPYRKPRRSRTAARCSGCTCCPRSAR